MDVRKKYALALIVKKILKAKHRVINVPLIGRVNRCKSDKASDPHLQKQYMLVKGFHKLQHRQCKYINIRDLNELIDSVVCASCEFSV